MITNKRVITCDCCDAEDNYPSGSIWFEVTIKTKKNKNMKFHTCGSRACVSDLLEEYLTSLESGGDKVSVEFKVV